MQKFDKLTGVAAPMNMINVDTDMIIPKNFLKTIKRSGLGKNLFDEMRFDREGNEKPDFILNKPAYREAKIIVAGDNFGCGSSREHAPWALLDFGIRCVISTSFADIFYNNCFNNGMLPLKLPRQQVEILLEDAAAGLELTVDLPNNEVRRSNGDVFTFELDEARKTNLLNGYDQIGLTMLKADKIVAFEAKRSIDTPWLDGATTRVPASMPVHEAVPV